MDHLFMKFLIRILINSRYCADSLQVVKWLGSLNADIVSLFK